MLSLARFWRAFGILGGGWTPHTPRYATDLPNDTALYIRGLDFFTKWRQECRFSGWNSNRSYPAYESERYCLCQHTLNVVRTLDGTESLFHLWLFISRYYVSIRHFRFLNKLIALKLVTKYTVHWSEKLKGGDSLEDLGGDGDNIKIGLKHIWVWMCALKQFGWGWGGVGVL